MKKLSKLQILWLVIAFILIIDCVLIVDNAHLTNNLEKNFAWEIYRLKYLDSLLFKNQLPIEPNKSYTIALVGDSMTDVLRFQESRFKDHLKFFYKDKEFVIYNYGFGSTNVLSLENRLHNDVNYSGQVYKKLLGEDFNLIIIESFGNNPLSEYPLDVGLKKQSEELDKVIAELKFAHPQSLIAFLATIAPSKAHYAEGVVELDLAHREKWARERESYILNHIKYAQSHNLPLINAFEKSIDKSGEANLEYLSPTDHIHPSTAGIDFINTEIANAIYNMRLLPL